MNIVMLPVLITISALLIFGVVANIALVDSIIDNSGLDKSEFLIGTFLLLLVFIIIAFALTYEM